MPSLFTRLTGGRFAVPAENRADTGTAAPIERKSMTYFTLTDPGDPRWSDRGYASLSHEGVMKNPVVYRCVRLIAESAARVPLVAAERGGGLTDHPLAALLAHPSVNQAGPALFEEIFAQLQTAGNAYLRALLVEGEVRALFALRPDRMRVVPGANGWPIAYSYTAGGRSEQLSQDTRPIPEVLHLKLFHPLDDHYGLSPLAAAGTSLDIHNAAARWNKALLDNAARPSGALVYAGTAGNLTRDQFARLKSELEEGFQGAANAGRPMVLEGGLDWKSMALSPRDMDFIEAKNAAARDIALAFGVPPMLLGIPGDNTYANYAEANRSFWRQTIVPLVRRVAASLTDWLALAFGEDLAITPQLEQIEALAEDRSALWARVGAAGFLTDDEKRELVGLPPRA